MNKKIVQYLKHPSKIFFWLGMHGFFKWMDDETYIKKQYKAVFGKEIDLENPQTFNEKLNWLKLHDRKEEYTTMVDKYEAKKYVSNIIGDEYIIPTIGIYDSFEKIDFDTLPQQFVMKCTHDSGGLVIVKDKSKLDYKKAKKKIEHCLKRNYFWNTREWPYKNVKPRIIVEKYMKDKNNEELRDYKFYCFNGKPKYLYVSEGMNNHKTARMDFFDIEFNLAPFWRNDYKRFNIKPEKPMNFAKMIELSEKLSLNTKFLRVDFYEINNKVYFSELTFSPCAGYMKFYPQEYDKKLGALINLK